MSMQLCLGTAQFGLSYGITNQKGQVSDDEVKKILSLAFHSDVQLFDTAQAYGTSEQVLGRCWPASMPKRVISKLSANSSPEIWESSFQRSLQQLQVEHLEAILLHRASDLLQPNGELLMDWLWSLRSRGLVRLIGVSIYEGEDLLGLPLDRLQLVQLPLSIYDQRLLHDGSIQKLRKLGLAIHVRSVFLQGLLLQDYSYWPSSLSSEFRLHHKNLQSYLQLQGVSLLEGALAFVRGCEGVEAVLVGVLSVSEFSEILKAWKRVLPLQSISFADFAWENKLDLDPRQWKQQ